MCARLDTETERRITSGVEEIYAHEDNIKIDLKNKIGVCGLNSHCSRQVAGVGSFNMIMCLRVP